MTSDRLRAAADRLADTSRPITLNEQLRQGVAAAALLRAVAWDWADVDADHDARTLRAALALADAVLGGTR